MTTQKSLEESLGSGTVSASLKVYIYYIPLLVHSPPQIVLLTSDLYEDLIDVECVATLGADASADGYI
jgi:hypothetical protein